ncbi:hypothetical protein AB4248_00260 [Vibrio splendidus]
MKATREKLRFDFIEISILGELDSYKEHTIKIEKFLTKEIEFFETKKQNTISRLSEYDKEAYLDFVDDIYWDLNETYPTIQRQSELISIYTLLENSLNQLCFTCEKYVENPIKMADLSSKGIVGKYKKYLEKVVQIKFPSESDSWNEIINIQEIRNAIVHNNSVVKSGNTRLLGYIKQSNYLLVNENYKIEIKSGFSLYCLDIFKTFFSELFLRMG